MVLQRDVPASVWGFADVDGQLVQVDFDGNVYSTTAFEGIKIKYYMKIC